MGQRRRAVGRICQLGGGTQPARVGGQHRRGQRDRLHPQRRKHRYDDRQRRPAEPRQVMDG